MWLFLLLEGGGGGGGGGRGEINCELLICFTVESLFSVNHNAVILSCSMAIRSGAEIFIKEVSFFKTLLESKRSSKRTSLTSLHN